MNIAIYRSSSESTASHMLDMYDEFRTGGEMDYKKDYGGKSYVDFGNFNFGAYSTAAGFTPFETIAFAQGYSLKSRWDFDQPRDQALIKAGIAYAQCVLGK